MVLCWDEIESSLSLELSVTKNAGKQSYFFNFHAVGYRFTASWVFNAIAMKCHQTSLPCSLVPPTAAASPGHLCQSRATLSAGLQYPPPCSFEAAPQPAQRQLLILLIHLCFGHPCFTAPYRRQTGKGFAKAGKAAKLGDKSSCLDIAWHLQNCCSGDRQRSGAFFFNLISATLAHQILRWEGWEWG